MNKHIGQDISYEPDGTCIFKAPTYIYKMKKGELSVEGWDKHTLGMFLAIFDSIDLPIDDFCNNYKFWVGKDIIDKLKELGYD
jgi:hypothetical protein